MADPRERQVFAEQIVRTTCPVCLKRERGSLIYTLFSYHYQHILLNGSYALNLTSAAFRPIIASSMTTFGSRLQHAAVEDRGRWLFLPSLSQAQQNPQIVDHRIEHPCLEPALGLLIDHFSRRQITEHHAPRRSCSHNPAQSIEHFTQLMYPLGASSVINVR